jgi:uncharacterized caspase-like protein
MAGMVMMRKGTARIAGLILVALATMPVSAATRVALVIANDAYRNAAHLRTAAGDAGLIAAALTQDGFAVSIANNLDYDSFFQTLRHFAKMADDADWAVVYYAGHSIAGDGINYLIPVDAKLASDRDLEGAAVPSNLLESTIAGARRVRLVIVDACRRNPFPGMSTHVRLATFGCARPVEREGTLVMYPSSPGETPVEGDGANSPFAHALADRLTEPGIELATMIRLVSHDVLRATEDQQTPFAYGSLSAIPFFFGPADARP